MLSDKIRTLTFRLALTRARQRLEGGILLDVGCGTAILSLFGAKAGAAHVYGLDGARSLCLLARQIVADNDLSSRITVINSKVEDAQLDVDRVDAIVSEWMGHALLYENMLPSVLYARDRYLRPSQTTAAMTTSDLATWRRKRLFPCCATLFIAAFSEAPVDAALEDDEKEEAEEGDKISAKCKELSDLYEVRLTGAFASAVREDLERQAHVDMMDPKCVVTTTSEVVTLDLATFSAAELSAHGVKGDFEVMAIGTVAVRGFVIWFSVEFPDGDVLSTSPYKAPTHWQQTLLYLSQPLPLRQGDVMSGRVDFTHPPNSPRDLNISIDFLLNNSEETRKNPIYLLSSN